MTTPLDLGSPVSAALEADLREWVRRHGIVPWLDLDDHYTAFVDRLIARRAAGRLPDMAVYAFRGSYLTLLLELETLGGATEKPKVIIHLPGFNEERVRQSPLYGLYAAGARYRKALPTLITEAAAGHVPPDQIDAFTGQPDLTLAAADAWLAAQRNRESSTLATQLQALSPSALVDDLLANGYVAQQLITGHMAQTLLGQQLAAWLGLPVTWFQALQLPQSPRPADVAYAIAGWAQAVEYLHDLRRPSKSPLLVAARELPRSVIDHCRALARHLRNHHAAFYRRTADELEVLLGDEVEIVQATDLGAIDTFRFEEAQVLTAALAALQTADWAAAHGWATPRVDPNADDGSFWLRNDPARQAVWQLVHAAAQLGRALVAAAAPLPTTGHAEAIAHYARYGTAVDQAHRHLEQRRVELLYPQLPAFETVRAALDGVRGHWQRWADDWARAFNTLCRAHGFLPDPIYQQRLLFDEVVRPLTQEAGTTAYFVIDAFRYEMGEELYRQLADTAASTVKLNARLAELPTVTAVGMNVLAPVVTNGRLTPVLQQGATGSRINGFTTGEFRVHDPDSRKRAIHDRVGGTTAPLLTLEAVINRESDSLKRTIAQARLVIVHSQEIDHAGEQEVGPTVFNSVMQQLRAAWHLLREAGVRRFVFTADHGFLLLNESSATVQAYGRKIDPLRRHVLAPVAAERAGEVRVALSDLGYTMSGDGATTAADAGAFGARYLIFPESTAVFNTGRKRTGYAHGGNSLQERLIPVLTIVHRAAAGGNQLAYAISARALEGVADMHSLAIRVELTAQQALDFGSPRTLEVALRVPEESAIQVELVQTRGNARLGSGAILAPIGEEFEIFFRLSGRTESRVRVEVHHPSALATVTAATTSERFAVTAARSSVAVSTADEAAATTAPVRNESWLEQLPAGGIRQLFAHLVAHGAVTETEATTMLGSGRAVRQFSIRFEEYARQAPFGVRIETVAGVKRYVRV